MNQTYGYVRVSTKEQNEARQLAAFDAAGILPENIYLDKRSGADFDRTQYRRLLRRLKAGDTLVVKSIDRLGLIYMGTDDKGMFSSAATCLARNI